MLNDFPIAKDAYVAFDGLTIKEKIRERLSQSGIFTDQNFEGSNLSALNDVVAMIASFLIFNTSKSAANGQFGITKLYETMNSIVKQLDYKPVGHQTSTVSYKLLTDTHPVGTFTIPRYANLKVGGLGFTTPRDITFTRSVLGSTETLTDIDSGGLLYQGQFVEYPTQFAAGNASETVTLNVDKNVTIDNFNIQVFVKSSSAKWEEWQKVSSAYLYNSGSKVFEVRFNENQKYEIKFGNDINGKKLTENDQIAIYYIRSDGKKGEIGANTINSKKMVSFVSSRYNQIMVDIANSINYTSSLDRLIFQNPLPSSYYNSPESVEQIRENAPANFRSQFSLTTQASYRTFIKSNFSNIIHDVVVMNNDEYLDSYSKYFYDLGLTKPQLEHRAMFNQVRYADACNFNNIYCFVVPKTIPNTLSYMVPEQKSLIINTMKEEKAHTAEVVLADPVYMALDFAVTGDGTLSLSDIENTSIVVEKDRGSRVNDANLKAQIDEVIQQFFDRKANRLGQTLHISQLNVNILAIEGVKNLYSCRTDTGTGAKLEGLQMLLWNPFYTDTVISINSNFTLDAFQFPYLNTRNLISRIQVI